MESIPVADFKEVLAQSKNENNNAFGSGFSLNSLSEELNNSSWGMGLSNSFISDTGDAHFIIKKQQEVYKKYESKHLELFMSCILAFLGLGVGLGSILEFKTYHLLHHQHIDTVKDPLNYELGWLFHQWGHLLFIGKKKSESEYLKNINKQKTQSYVGNITSAVIRWQHACRFQMLFINWVLFPLMVSKSMNISKWDCIVWLTFVKLALIQQQWLFSETWGHKYPIFLARNKKKLDYLKMPSVNSSLDLPLILNYVIGNFVLGETNHDFHHAFPNDFRQSNKWYYVDIQKWIILCWYYTGIVTKVYRVNDTHIMKHKLESEQRLLDYELNLNSKMKNHVSVNDLPIWTVDEFAYKSAKLWKEEKIALVLVDGIIHDVTSFISGHPGGEQLIISAIGKDATEAFNGGVYFHSNASRNLMSNMRIGVLITENNGVWGKHNNISRNKEDEDDLEYRRRLEIIKLQNSKKFFAPLAA